MENKFNMTKEDNIFFAKRKLIDNIYKSANLEGITVTFADTYANPYCLSGCQTL